IRQQSVLNAAARRAGCRRKAVRGASEIIDERVVPIAGEFAGNAEPRASCIDAAVEVLHGRKSGCGLIIEIVADIEMQPSGQKDRVSSVGALQPEAILRRLHDMRRGSRRWYRGQRRWSRYDSDRGQWLTCRGTYGLRLCTSLRGLALRLAQLLSGIAELALQLVQFTLEL